MFGRGMILTSTSPTTAAPLGTASRNTSAAMPANPRVYNDGGAARVDRVAADCADFCGRTCSACRSHCYETWE